MINTDLNQALSVLGVRQYTNKSAIQDAYTIHLRRLNIQKEKCSIDLYLKSMTGADVSQELTQLDLINSQLDLINDAYGQLMQSNEKPQEPSDSNWYSDLFIIGYLKIKRWYLSFIEYLCTKNSEPEQQPDIKDQTIRQQESSVESENAENTDDKWLALVKFIVFVIGFALMFSTAFKMLDAMMGSLDGPLHTISTR